MTFNKDVKKSWKLIYCPSKEAGVRFGVGRALKFYYGATLIPLLLIIVLGYFGMLTGTITQTIAFVPFAKLFMNFLNVPQALILSTILLLWVTVPIAFFIDAFIYQLVGKNFLRVFKGDYENTFSALVFGIMPYLLLFWLFLLPVVNIIALIVLPIWSFVIEVVAFSMQQRATRLQIIGTMFTIVILLTLLVVLMVAAVHMSFYSGVCWGVRPCTTPIFR
jgi:predicted neutral ceramidase superfamily lipid hydrolase